MADEICVLFEMKTSSNTITPLRTTVKKVAAAPPTGSSRVPYQSPGTKKHLTLSGSKKEPRTRAKEKVLKNVTHHASQHNTDK